MPALNDVGIVFGLLQIVWFVGLGIVLLRTTSRPEAPLMLAAGCSHTVLLLGGTGRTGGRVLEQLLSRGVNVRAVVRSAGRLPAGVVANPLLTVVEADLLSLSGDEPGNMSPGATWWSRASGMSRTSRAYSDRRATWSPGPCRGCAVRSRFCSQPSRSGSF